MQCPYCQNELQGYSAFCPRCGYRLVPAQTASVAAAPKPGHAGAAIGLIFLLVLGGLFMAGELTPLAGRLYGDTQRVLTGVMCLYPPLCPGSSYVTTPGKASYDQQVSLTFGQDFSSLSYNVSAVPQSDSYGYGPAYLLNGHSDTGYWYQIGLAYNWPLASGNSYDQGFHFIWEVFDPNGTTNNPSLSNIRDNVNANDTVGLSLYFSGGNVVLSAVDYDTGATMSQTYTAGGGSRFVGSSSFGSTTTPTSLMTEWYHPDPNWTMMKQVVYSENSAPVSSGWACISEYVPPNPSSGVYQGCSLQMSLGNSPQAYSYRGINTYSSQSTFQTGPSP
jgi:hypothetical protein